MTERQQQKQIIRQFMRDNYTDERLAMLLAHAQEGKLEYHSCCCFIGVPTADHALQNEIRDLPSSHHYFTGVRLVNANAAEKAYYLLGVRASRSDTEDALRRRILIPIIRAEMKRREFRKAAVERVAEAVLAGAEKESTWVRQESCPECDGDGCARCAEKELTR
jgi:hypothetical protein